MDCHFMVVLAQVQAVAKCLPLNRVKTLRKWQLNLKKQRNRFNLKPKTIFSSRLEILQSNQQLLNKPKFQHQTDPQAK
jgi:hypothetical protein